MEAVTRFQILRGTTAQRLAFIPLKAELVMDLESSILYIGDGVTPGGVLAAPLAENTNKVIAVVRNETGSTILKGTPVYISGATGSGQPLIAPSDASNLATLPSSGIIESDIFNNSNGLMILIGDVGALDTSSFASGDEVFIQVGGGLTNIKPVEPNYIQTIGIVKYAHPTQGTVLVNAREINIFANLPADEVLIGQAGGNSTTTNLENRIENNTFVQATASALSAHVGDFANPHGVTKSQVGLGNADNTSDLDKPISNATQAALNLKYDASNPNGYETPAQLDARDTSNRARANHTGTQLASTISDFASTVRTTVLTGYVVGTNAAIAATDTILQAFGKAQGQINALFGRIISAGYGLTGGGDLTADRSFAVSLTDDTLSSSAPFVSSTLTDTLITGFTLTPPAGKYLVIASLAHTNTNNNRINTFSLYKDGVQIADSEKGSFAHSVGNNSVSLFSFQTFNGSETIDVRVRPDANTVTVNTRSLMLLRIS